MKLVIEINEKDFKCIKHVNNTNVLLLTESRAILAVKMGKPLDCVLDEIKAKIEKLPTSKCSETRIIYINADDFKENVLEIFDKYKAEGSEKE